MACRRPCSGHRCFRIIRKSVFVALIRHLILQLRHIGRTIRREALVRDRRDDLDKPAVAGLALVGHGEAIGGGSKGNGKTARAGLVRALRAHQGIGAEADLWAGGISREYRKLLMSGAVGKSSETVGRDGQRETNVLRKGISKEQAETAGGTDGEIPFGKVLRCRVRYFTDGAVIGSRNFVDEAFISARERFGSKRKSGARKLKGDAAPANGVLWSLRDLKKGIA